MVHEGCSFISWSLSVLFFQIKNGGGVGLSRAHLALPPLSAWFPTAVFQQSLHPFTPSPTLYLDTHQVLHVSPLLDLNPASVSPLSPDPMTLKHVPGSGPASADPLLTSWASVPAWFLYCLAPPYRWFQHRLLFKRAASGSHVN